MRLIYEKLVEDYMQSLHSKLRNFGVEPEFLGMWVHDEDDNKSIFELFLAAQDAGLTELTLAVGQETVKKLDVARLAKELAILGEVKPISKQDPLELHINFKAPAAATTAPPSEKTPQRTKTPIKSVPSRKNNSAQSAPSNERPAGVVLNGQAVAVALKRKLEEIYPAYQAAIRKAEGSIAWEGDLPKAAAGSIAVAIEQDGIRMGAIVDSKGVVTETRHKGAKGVLRVLLDQVCGLMIGRPIQEAQDHVVIRLEAKLRDHSVAVPVAGVVTPRNADPIFQAPQKLVRDLYREYLKRSGAKPQWNFWDDSAGADWAKLSAEEKLNRARSAVCDGCKKLGISADGIEVLEILGDVRLVFAHTPATGGADFGPRMMRLESLVKKALDPRIELQLESLEDRNRRATRTDRTHKLT